MGRLSCSNPLREQRPAVQTEGNREPVRDTEREHFSKSGQHSSIRRMMCFMVELNWNKMG